jgi:hypothetical protein
LSLELLDIYITPRPSHPGSAVASMTQQLHHDVVKLPR